MFIAQARALAEEVNASVDQMKAMLDRAIARIDTVVDPALEAARRTEIFVGSRATRAAARSRTASALARMSWAADLLASTTQDPCDASILAQSWSIGKMVRSTRKDW